MTGNIVVFGEVFCIGNLDDKTRELVTITALITNQTLPQRTAHTNAALNVQGAITEADRLPTLASHVLPMPFIPSGK
ncbi:carboxymuconolactone decarboxylase family protein [Dyadobacter endophyticus]|uniref:carboxymuconolactone decarboxylase family protein n=1 Tax=Dyadobacter endophyticus TaxID=1749036 RepID=UPI0034D97A9E